MTNPYDWQWHRPAVEVPRAEFMPIVEILRRGGSAVVLGGRGMGKSVFLRQVEAEVKRAADVRAFLFRAPPPKFTVDACLKALARQLGLTTGGPFDNCSDLLETYLRRSDSPAQIVLLYDEFDRYARTRGREHTDAPGRHFFNDLEAARRDLSGIGILAAGSIGVFVLRDVLGSSFVSRAEHFWLNPFGRSDLQTLARPFVKQGNVLPQEVLDALCLATGGLPALTTYGFQHLWDIGAPTERDVADIFRRFQERHREFLRDVTLSFSDPRLSEAPQKIRDLIEKSGGTVPRSALQDACGLPGGPLHLDFVDVLRLLQAAGLVRVIGSMTADDPIAVYPIASILNLPAASSPSARFQDRFFKDLEQLLAVLHASSADFFRSGARSPDRQLVPEAVFSAFLAMGLGCLGWQVEREAQSAAGRTDIKVRREGFEGLAIVEVKIWGRNDYQEVHRQVESYWSANIVAGAVVMLTDAELQDWPEDYQHRCLAPYGIRATLSEYSNSPIRARFPCTSTTADGMGALIDHFLLRLPRRR